VASAGVPTPYGDRIEVAEFAALVGRLDQQGGGPLHHKMSEAFRRAILQGRLLPNQALPAEREIAESYSLSRVTVRKALDTLVKEGLVLRRQGAGTFVSGLAAPAPERVEKSFARLSSFSEDMRSRGRVPTSKMLRCQEGAVTPKEAMTLNLGPGTPVYRYHRLRFADGLPMAIEYSTIPAYCLPRLEAVTDSLYGALAAAGSSPVRALQRLRAILFNQEQAALLSVAEGDPGLLIERSAFMENGRAVEFTQSFYRGDAYDFVAELTQVPAPGFGP
jgi:GntR family transcriptional regulator